MIAIINAQIILPAPFGPEPQIFRNGVPQIFRNHQATLPGAIDYTDKDFDALPARLIALIKSVFPDWTDFDVASFGNLLVELYAYVGDVLTFGSCPPPR